MTPEQLEGKILTGLLHESDRQEYVAQYETLATRARAKAGATA
jgi:2-oxoglutarate ferredoxin oxidoreductase subunit beta